jgi:hypothetical protein
MKLLFSIIFNRIVFKNAEIKTLFFFYFIDQIFEFLKTKVFYFIFIISKYSVLQKINF